MIRVDKELYVIRICLRIHRAESSRNELIKWELIVIESRESCFYFYIELNVIERTESFFMLFISNYMLLK